MAYFLHYDKQDDFNFEIVNFPFLDGDGPCSPSYGVYISQLIRFARLCSKVDEFNNRNLFLTAIRKLFCLLKACYRLSTLYGTHHLYQESIKSN